MGNGGSVSGMKNVSIALAAVLTLVVPLKAQDPEAALSPNEIVAEASADEWVAIPAEDLLVMTLAPDRDGTEREVVIQLMPEPFSQGWVENIRILARARWYDGITVNRVQDNYVVQWGDPNYDNPEGEGVAKPLPDGLRVMDEVNYDEGITADIQAALRKKLQNEEARLRAAFAEPTGDQKNSRNSSSYSTRCVF